MQFAPDCFTSIREGFARVSRTDPAWRLPALPTLELPLNPVLHSEDVLWFETRCAIRLPAAYRRFLSQIGNGGGRAGLDALGAHVGEGPDCLPGEALAHPCKIAPGMSVARWQLLAGALQKACKSGEAERTAARAYVYSGLLPVATSAGGRLECLVLDGPYAGRVVGIDLQGQGAPDFAAESDFMSWYWQNRAPAGVRPG